MIKPAIIALLCLLPGAAQAALSDRLSAEDYARMTQETPYRMDCPFDKAHGWYDCPAQQETRYPVSSDDYLPPVVPEQRAKIAPLLTSMFGAINNVCRKVGKNSEYCQELGRHGADEIGAQLAAGDQ